MRARLELFSEAKRDIGLPTVAIGGITAENATFAIQAGADSIAVIGALWTAPDIRLAARLFTNLFTRN